MLFNKLKTQTGAALITSLVILLVLTILGVSAMSTSNLEEFMTGNFRDKDASFQAAETALTDAERSLETMPAYVTATDSGTDLHGGLDKVFSKDIFGAYEFSAFNPGVWSLATTYGSVSGSPNIPDVFAQPTYLIEEIQFVPKSKKLEDRIKLRGNTYYQITARGQGTSENAITLLQTTFGRKFQ